MLGWNPYRNPVDSFLKPYGPYLGRRYDPGGALEKFLARRRKIIWERGSVKLIY